VSRHFLFYHGGSQLPIEFVRETFTAPIPPPPIPLAGDKYFRHRWHGHVVSSRTIDHRSSHTNLVQGSLPPPLIGGHLLAAAPPPPPPPRPPRPLVYLAGEEARLAASVR